MLEITIKGVEKKVFYNSNDVLLYIENIENLSRNYLKCNIMENITLTIKEPNINDVFEYQIIIMKILEKRGYKLYNFSNSESNSDEINKKLDWSYYVLTQNKKMTVSKLIDIVKRTNPLIIIPQTQSNEVFKHYNQ